MKPQRVQIARRKTPVVLKTRGPKLTKRQVARFERNLGHTLPADYREFLLRYNGGYPEVGAVNGRDDDPSAPYQHGDGVRVFLKLPPTTAGDVADYERLRSPAELHWDLPPDVLPIAEDGGGNLFVLELGKRKGVVRFLDHEALDKPLARHRVMADNFLDLLLRFRSTEEQKAIDAKSSSAERRALATGKFPARLEAQCRAVAKTHPQIRTWIRALCLRIFDAKGYFAFHADDLSRTFLDLVFWLNQSARRAESPLLRKELEDIVMGWWKDGDAGFGLTGHAPGFLQEWWNDRLAQGALQGTRERARFTGRASATLLRQLTAQPT